jgi:hypothetical protein
MGVFHTADLLFHVWAPLAASDTAQRFTLGIAERLAPYLIDIWPNQAGEVVWPPLGVFRLDDLETQWPPRVSLVVPQRAA